MADAKIRIRMDAADVKRGLSEIRGEFARTADAAGQVGGGFRFSLGRMAAIGSLGLGGFALGRGVLGGGRALGQAATEGPSALLEELALGDRGAKARGSLQALERTKQVAALAVGLGADPRQFDAMFRVFERMEQATEKGQLKLAETFGLKIADELLSGLWNDILDELKGIRKTLGGTP